MTTRAHNAPITSHARQTSSNAELLIFIFFPSLQRFCLLSGLQTVAVVLLLSETSSNLLNDDTYQCICADNCVIHPDK